MANEGGNGVGQETQQGTGKPEGQTQDTKPAAKAEGTQQTADSKTTSTSQQPGAGQNAGDDRRISGLTADLQKERKARQEFEKNFKALEARLAERDRQIAALTGTKTPSAEEAEIEEIRAQFKRVFPKLASLTDEQIDKVLKVTESTDQLEQTANHYWTEKARNYAEQLESEVAEIVGGELTERQRNQLLAAYIWEVENNPETTEKYERGDRTHIKQFAKEWTDDWLTSATRKVTASTVNRLRPVPKSGDRSVTTTGGKKIDFNNPKAVEDAMVESFKSHGGQFGD